MTEIQNLQAMGAQRMTSLEIAEITGKQHKNLMRDIRNMEAAWEKTCGLKFELTSRTISQPNGGTRIVPYYSLNKMECLYIATKFNDEARHPTSAGDGSGRDARGRAHRGPRAHQRQQTRRRLHHHHGHRQSGRNGDKGTELVPEGSGCSEMEPGSVQADRELRRARSGSGQALRLLREGRENEKEHLSRLDYKGC